MERNTGERAMKTETDTRTEQKGVGKMVGLFGTASAQNRDWFMSDRNHNIPTA